MSLTFIYVCFFIIVHKIMTITLENILFEIFMLVSLIDNNCLSLNIDLLECLYFFVFFIILYLSHFI